METMPLNLPIPEFNPETQYLGNPESDVNGEWYFPVIDYTDSELLKIQKQKIEYRKKIILERKSQDIALEFFQAITDPIESDKIKEVFPLWDPNAEYSKEKYKVTKIMPDGKLALFELSSKTTVKKGTDPEHSKTHWNKITV